MRCFEKISGLVLCLSSFVFSIFAQEILPKVVVKIGPTSISSDEYVSRLIERDDNKSIENLINEKVIELELKELKLPFVTEKDIDNYIDLMEKQLKLMQGQYANINTFLQNTKMKMSELRQKTKREIGMRRILGQAIEVKEEEMLKYYENFKGQFYTFPEARRVIAITVFHRESPAPKMLQTDITEAEAKKIAENIRKSWVEKDDYVKTLWDAKQHFIRGYDEPYGIPTTLKTDKNFSQVFATDQGKITEVILDKNGFNIYKVIEDMPSKVMPYEKAKDNIKNELISNKIGKALEEGAFENIKKKYKIERFDKAKEEK